LEFADFAGGELSPLPLDLGGVLLEEAAGAARKAVFAEVLHIGLPSVSMKESRLARSISVTPRFFPGLRIEIALTLCSRIRA
jgi:hypothetical protein